MNNNFLGLIMSVIYIVVVVGLASFCYKKKKFTVNESRSFIHIGLCNWWLIAWIYFDNYWIASIVPLFLLIFNILNYRFHLVPGIENVSKNKRHLGSIWYSLALLLLTFVFFQNKVYMYIGAISILSLGYGDGLATLIGDYFGKHKFGVRNKSAEGSFTMLFITFLLITILLQNVFPTEVVASYALYISVFATLVELFAPGGTDNLLVPLLTAGYTYLLVRYSWFMPIALSFTTTSIIIYIVLLTRKLTPAASFWSIILGTAVYVLAGPVPYACVLLFYLTSIMIEHGHKKPLSEKQRNLTQVEEDSLATVLFAIMYYFTGSEAALVAVFVSIAGATSDTWSSGLGYYSKEKVRSILTGKPLPKGESGGVTQLGTMGAFLGSLLIALFSLLMPGGNLLLRFILVLGFGFFTSIIDSIFGVFLQVKYYDEAKGLVLEKRPKNMKGIKKISGYPFLTNGMVNFVTVMMGSVLSAIVSIFLF